MPVRFLSALVFCLLVAVAAQAQEHGYGKEGFPHLDTYEHHPLNPEVSRMHPPDSAYFGHNLEYARNVAPKTRNRQSESKQQEEDALRFNFLYFIIQKFKFSEIVD